MWIGVGKLIQQGTRENHQSLNVLLSIWTNPGIACLEVAKTMKSNQLSCGRGIPCKDEGLEKGNLLIIFIFISFVHKMHEDMFLHKYDITY